MRLVGLPAPLPGMEENMNKGNKRISNHAMDRIIDYIEKATAIFEAVSENGLYLTGADAEREAYLLAAVAKLEYYINETTFE